MTLSPELQRIYTSAPVNTPYYEALVLTHGSWSEVVAIINNTVTDTVKNFNGAPINFTAAVFEVQLPKRDDLGVVEMTISFPIVTRRMMELIAQAEAARTPILATLLVYTDSSAESQLTPLELQLDSIAITEELVSGIASRVDLLNKVYPRNIVRPENYPGLYR
jgi:hypothetical protein